VSELSDLLDQILAGSERSWQRFFLRVGPQVEQIAQRSRALGSLRRQPDDYRNVMTRVFERLRRDDFRALRLYREWQARNAERTFDDWLTVVTTNVARDYVDERMGTGEQPNKRLANTLSEVLDENDDALAVSAHITPKLVAQQIMELAKSVLSPEQLAILSRWLGGTECATDDEKKLLRAALGRLRRSLAVD
jgi:hypothetical protein